VGGIHPNMQNGSACTLLCHHKGRVKPGGENDTFEINLMGREARARTGPRALTPRRSSLRHGADLRMEIISSWATRSCRDLGRYFSTQGMLLKA
jgi:hypothetical protein